MSFDESSAVRSEHDSEFTPVEGASAPTATDDGWLRLDKRKLLLDPINAIKSMIIPIIALLFGFSNVDNPWFMIVVPFVVAIAAVFGLLPWFTTTYRITPTHFQLRKGVLSKTNSTASLDRIRSVDLEATVLHRLLGMRKVQIGTGVDSERIELDAVTTERADELRSMLLTARAASTTPVVTAPPVAAGGESDVVDHDHATFPTSEPEPEQVLAVLDWTWLRFAPFGLGRLAVVAAAIGLFSQFANDVEIDYEGIADSTKAALRIGVLVLGVLIALVLFIGWLIISVTGYLVQWWGLRLTRAHGTLQMSAGLLTTRSISVEEKRVRGIELVEPLLLRPVNGAELSTLATGVGDGGTTKILPQCPTDVATQVASDVLGDAYPMRVQLTQHGFAARRRRHIAQQRITLLLLGVGFGIHRFVLPLSDAEGELWWFLAPGALWLVLGLVFAELSYRHLGHFLTDDHLVAGHGITARKRTVLETDGIIGWVFDQSFFQRRVGLVTLQATTAAGGEQVTVTDVPLDVAIRLAASATAEPVRPFLA